MTKEEIKKLFEDSLLPMEVLARDRFDYFLTESGDEKANALIERIRDDEIRHIGLVKRAIEILSK